jgi:poly(3-hydroxybutyrate) depolymerase
MVIHGDSDDVVNPVNATQIVDQFAVMNELLAEDAHLHPGEIQLKSRTDRFNSGHRYEITDLRRGGHTLIRKVMVSGLGHAWSGGPDRYPFGDPKGPNASELICDFFADYGLRESHLTQTQ